MKIPRCQLIPLPDSQVAFQIDGKERLRWHVDHRYPRPFFFPLLGPSGQALTRMGHPGAPDHDHHRSIWFAHEKVMGVNFWSDRTSARIQQKSWLGYQDGNADATMAVALGWYDGHDPKELLEQELIVSLRPGENGEIFVELQSTFRPLAESLEFGKTNFGFLAIRVAKSVSEYFGGGRLTNSNAQTGEAAIFGKKAVWVDYSGPLPGGLTEGITYFDHASNPSHPSAWHVREDGWMGASVCFAGPVTTTKSTPLVLRYLLHVHSGSVDADRAAKVWDEFRMSPKWGVVKSRAKHSAHEIRRADGKG